MTTTVLVAYATKYGSTREVAETIAATISQSGAQVEILPARNVRSLDGYNAVVLGAALYVGHWYKDARTFLKRHRAALAHLPVAVFTLGPLGNTEKEWQGSRTQLDRELEKASWLTPVAVGLFGGVINPAQLHFPFNRMPAGDARDWKAIRAWAAQLATQFHPLPIVSNTSAPVPVER